MIVRVCAKIRNFEISILGLKPETGVGRKKNKVVETKNRASNFLNYR